MELAQGVLTLLLLLLRRLLLLLLPGWNGR
jgi:hypothetical protein